MNALIKSMHIDIMAVIMRSKQFYYKNNRIQQLKGFYYTALKGGVSKAAQHMCLTQSTVSSQIKSLERDLGVQLFKREKRSMALTADGTLLYEMAVPLLQGIDSIYEEFLLEKKHDKTINICANHISMLYLLPNFIKENQDTYPDVKYNLCNIQRETAIERLLNNETELCLYPVIDIPQECEFIHVANFNPILLLRRDHPLASKKDLRLEDVSSENLIRIDPHLITLPHFEETINNYKLSGNITFESGDWEMLKSLVKAKVGVAIISNICIEKNDNSLVGRSLTNYFPSMSYGFLIKKGHRLSDEVSNFLDLMKKKLPL